MSLRLILCAGLLLLTPVPAVASTVLEAGDPFPELRLPSLDEGEPLSIADFRGRKVALHVFASW